MKMTTIILLLLCGSETFLLVEANKALDAQNYYIKQEVETAYRYACAGDGMGKTIIECGMEATDYTEKFLPKK